MKKILLVFLSLFLFSTSLFAKQLKVIEFRHDPSDISAQVNQVNDLNGDACALIKVGLAIADATFEGDVIKSEYKESEYYVYFPAGSNWIVVKAPGNTPVRYEFEPLVAKNTYIMTIGEEGGVPKLLPITLEAKTNVLGEKIKNEVKFNMILVEPGNYQRGATAEQSKPDKDEYPVHWVTISNQFYMGETEVTQELWEYVMGDNPSFTKGPQRPVDNISWNMALDFTKKLSNLLGVFFRLPTEAEWEYVARGGTKTQRYQFSGSDNLDDVAWYYDNSANSSHDVKTKQPNELGFYDMSGNVWELCMDSKAEYKKGDLVDPVGLESSKDRVRRGGAWNEKVGETNAMRVAFRRRIPQTEVNKVTGLRLVIDLTKKVE